MYEGPCRLVESVRLQILLEYWCQDRQIFKQNWRTESVDWQEQHESKANQAWYWWHLKAEKEEIFMQLDEIEREK